jgi:hypothetical protein
VNDRVRLEVRFEVDLPSGQVEKWIDHFKMELKHDVEESTILSGGRWAIATLVRKDNIYTPQCKFHCLGRWTGGP